MTSLRGIHFPARKHEILAVARSNGAPDVVIDELERLEDTAEFGGPQDIMKRFRRRQAE
jgi:hypothetical protein